jgi:hypothetical protein
MKKILILSVTLLSLLGCSQGYDQQGDEINMNYGRNLSPPDGIMKKENGFEYILTCIENTQFISYQSAHGIWELTSTGKECNKNEL